MQAMTLQLTVPDMACAACVSTITQAINTVDPAAKVEADPKTKQVNVETQANEVAIKQAITTAGYTIG
jgi:copper chaperone